MHHARAMSVQIVENLMHIKTFTSTNCYDLYLTDSFWEKLQPWSTIKAWLEYHYKAWLITKVKMHYNFSYLLTVVIFQTIVFSENIAETIKLLYFSNPLCTNITQIFFGKQQFNFINNKTTISPRKSTLYLTHGLSQSP